MRSSSRSRRGRYRDGRHGDDYLGRHAPNPLHGGALMALADSLGATCAFANLPDGASTTTLESKTNFFHAVRAGHVRGTARPLHVGRTSIVVQTDLYDAEGRRVAQVTQTRAVLNR
ncbi:PaaI family thioesterase [Spirillospora sp. CA-253888]